MNSSNRQVWGVVLIVFGVLVIAGAVVRFIHPLNFITKQATDVVNQISNNVPNMNNINFDDASHATQSGSQTFDTTHITKLVLHNQAGKIHITTDPNAKQATVNYVKGMPVEWNSASDKQRFEDFQVNLQASGDTEQIDVNGDNTSALFRQGYVNFDIVVPPTLAVDVENNTGEVTTLGLASNVTVRLNAGKIAVDGFSGTADVQSNAGEVTVTNGQNIKRLDASTNAGAVKVTLPEHANLTIDAKTDVGMVSCQQFPLTVVKHLPGSSLHGSLGTGNDGTVNVHSNAGAVTISKQ